MKLAVFSKFLVSHSFLMHRVAPYITEHDLFICMQKKKKYCINKEQHFLNKKTQWSYLVLECVLFTFAKPYLNFVYHEIRRIPQIILVLRGFFVCFCCSCPGGSFCIVRQHLLT